MARASGKGSGGAGGSGGLGSFADLGALKKQLKVQAEQDRLATLQRQQQARQVDNDANLFRKQIGAVTPIKVAPTAPPPSPTAHTALASKAASVPAKPITTMAEAMQQASTWSDDFEHAAKGEDDGVSYTAPGSAPDLLNRLRKLQWPVQATLDLHGKQRDQARNALADFLHRARLARLRCVCVVHGQGFNSRDTAVLPAKVRTWLAQSDVVRAYCQAPDAQGGAGALLVLLAND